MARNILVATTLALAGVLVACGADDIDTEATRDTIEETGQEARQAAEEAMADLRTGAERFVDQMQTRDAPQAKQQLLERCRDVLERLRKADSDDAGRVESVCDRIRDTDVENASAWDEIKKEIEKLD